MKKREAAKNVLRYLAKAERRCGERPALVGADGEVWTFSDLDARVDWMAAGLREEGVEPGDRVIIMVPMSLKLYQVLLAVLKLGAVAVFVDPWVGAAQIARFAAYAEPRGFVGVGKSHVVRLFNKQLRTLPVTVTTGRRVCCVPARRMWSEVVRFDGPVELYPNRPEDTALITFTSGSSGMPKGADRTHRFLAAQHEALNQEFPYEDDDVDLPTFPVFSLNNLANGITTVIPDMDFRNVADVDGARILEQMKESGVTTATASPPFFDRLAEALEVSGEEIGLRRILTGGAPVTDGQLRRWREAMPETEIIVIYGSTEAEPVAHIGLAERLSVAEKSSSAAGYCVGRPAGAISAKVIPIRRGPVVLERRGWKELELGQGEVGELVVSGDHVCQRYFRNPEATAENKIVEDDGRVWHRMGDTGYLDEKGRFWLTGRVHSTIIRDGVAIQAQVVEQVGRGSDERIQRIAAVGMNDDVRGEELIVVVETDVASSAGRDEVLFGVRARLKESEIEIDGLVCRTEPIPVDPRHNSKVDYGVLRGQLLQDEESSRRVESLEV